MPKIIVFFNGPPDSGKDTIVNNYIQTYDEGVNIKFAQPIRDAALATFPNILDNDNFDHMKSQLLPYFKENGESMTLRQWMIAFSEQFMKSCFGKQIFGRILLDKIKQEPSNLIFITDCGFVEEILPIMADPELKKEGVCFCLIHLYRKGYDFSNDSRNYIPLNDYAWHFFHKMYNNSTILAKSDELYNFILEIGYMVRQYNVCNTLRQDITEMSCENTTEQEEHIYNAPKHFERWLDRLNSKTKKDIVTNNRDFSDEFPEHLRGNDLDVFHNISVEALKIHLRKMKTKDSDREKF